MKQLNEALKEFNKTNPILKPRLCLNENTGMYLVTLGFSKQYCTAQNLKVILMQIYTNIICKLKIASVYHISLR